MVKGAIRTDFILSAEIMVISLNEVADEGLLSRAVILVVVGLAITAAVYGVVGLIVKMDDVGLHLSERRSAAAQQVGRLWSAACPAPGALSTVGMVAMLWVGGHILLVGADDLGWHAPYGLVHHPEEAVATAVPSRPVLAWLVNTVASAVIGVSSAPWSCRCCTWCGGRRRFPQRSDPARAQGPRNVP